MDNCLTHFTEIKTLKIFQIAKFGGNGSIQIVEACVGNWMKQAKLTTRR